MIKIERASTRDLTEVVDLFEKYRAFYHREPARGDAERFIGERLANGDSAIYLARDGGERARAVGLMQLYPLFSSTAMKRLWLLNDLYVEASHRRRGVARQLIGAAEELCRATGARGFFLETEATNTRAQALYESVGMSRIPSYFYGVDVV
jgi:ribosomal protein S18 acetylase RimI-like enzyme